MPQLDLSTLRAVADRLESIGLAHAFVGGAVVNLLLDDPDFAPARPTDDCDVIIEAVTQRGYADLERRLREAGFDHDMRPGAPRCRWLMGSVIVDIMPVEASFLGLRTSWFQEALSSAGTRVLGGIPLRIVGAPAFLGLKLSAFDDRGESDYFGSHDLEDLVTVIDGRASIVAEVEASAEPLRLHVGSSLKRLLAEPSFMESLPGHLPADRASQRRLPTLIAKLNALAGVAR